MSHVVIDHHHDKDGGVYKIVVGVPVYDERTHPAMDADGNVLADEPRTEQVLVGYEDVRDFVFSEDDERWFVDGEERTHRHGRDRIAQLQREIVAEALAPSEEPDEPTPAPTVTTLPGVGEAL